LNFSIIYERLFVKVPSSLLSEPEAVATWFFVNGEWSFYDWNAGDPPATPETA